jgi:hypothetical protein
MDRDRHVISDMRRRIPVPRYTLRKIGFLLSIGAVTMAGAQGALPGWSSFSADLRERIVQVREDSPEQALARMVADGAIKPARQADIDNWVRVARLSDKERGNLSLYPEMTYVVLEPIRLPSDMYGAHAREFIIPSGVPLPENGRPSHNGFYFMQSGACIGGSSACSF